MESFLGCDSSDAMPEMRILCGDLSIESMFVLEEKVYVFRVDKYWIFEFNAQNTEHPLGPLIEGNIKISDKWKGIDGSDNRFTIHNNKIVAISSHKWTEFEINGEISKSENILGPSFEPSNEDYPIDYTTELLDIEYEKLDEDYEQTLNVSSTHFFLHS